MVTLWDGNGNNQHTSHHTSHHRLTTQMQMRLYTFIQEDMTVFFEILVKCNSSTCMITWRIRHPGRESDSPIFNWGYIWLDVEIQTEKSCLTQPLHLRSRQEGRGQPCLNKHPDNDRQTQNTLGGLKKEVLPMCLCQTCVNWITTLWLKMDTSLPSYES